MLFRPHPRRLTLWIACFAVLMASLAPAISHAMRAISGDAGSGWVEVCTLAGSKWVRADDASAPSGSSAPAKTLAVEHCPYCALHAASLALPPGAPQPWLAALPLRFAAPAGVLAAPRDGLTWRIAQPRGPPFTA